MSARNLESSIKAFNDYLGGFKPAIYILAFIIKFWACLFALICSSSKINCMANIKP